MWGSALGVILVAILQIHALSVSEYSGLLSLYDHLDGPSWQWPHPIGRLPRPWNVSVPRSRVCCLWDGIICQCPDDRCICDEDEKQSVIALQLSGIGLEGDFIHLNLTMFPNLHQLEADNNPKLQPGPIPPLKTWLPFPSIMEILTISNTSRTGEAPSFQPMSKIISLVLSHNSIENCPSLPPTIKFFDVASNNINTCFSTLFNNTPHLTSIYLDNNHLVELPDLSVPSLSNLGTLSASFNLLSEFPHFVNPSSLYQISLSSNRLQFTLTESFFGNFVNLTTIHLADNNIVGCVPHFYNNSKLRGINLAGNQLTGSMPLFRLPKLISLNLSSNWLQGPIQPFTLDFEGQYSIVDVSCNHMQGPLPPWPFYPHTYVYDFYNGSDVSYCPKAVHAPTPTPTSSSSSSFTISWSSVGIGAAIGSVIVAIIAYGCWKRNTCTHRRSVPLSSLTDDD